MMVNKPPKKSTETDKDTLSARTFSRQRRTPFPMFVTRCEPPRSDIGADGSRRLSVFVSQRLRSHGVEHLWDTVIVECDEESDGTLNMIVVISNPDWEEHLQIAHLRSKPGDPHTLTALGCNLDHRRTRI